MAKVNCASCEELKKDAPSAVVNGLDTTEVASLKNNTGLNPSAGNDDCTDLNNLNDCLIGNMEEEVKLYDVCDWQEFMSEFVPNVYNVDKGIIAAICGLWAKGSSDPRVDEILTRLARIENAVSDISTTIEGFEDRFNGMCRLIEATLQHPVFAYGTNPNISDEAQKGGVIAQKNGVPILTPLERSEVASEAAWLGQNVGFRYGKLEITNCEGNCVRHEWIAPSVYAYRFNADVAPEYDDMLWSIDKASATGRMGMTNDMWEIREANPITWAADWTAGRAIIALRLSVENDRLVLRYRGAIGASDSSLAGQTITPPSDQAERLYRFDC